MKNKKNERQTIVSMFYSNNSKAMLYAQCLCSVKKKNNNLNVYIRMKRNKNKPGNSEDVENLANFIMYKVRLKLLNTLKLF